MFEVNRAINYLSFHVGVEVESIWASAPQTRQGDYIASLYCSDGKSFEFSARSKRTLERDIRAVLALQAHDVEMVWL